MSNIIPALVALTLLVGFLFVPLPAQQLVSFRENVSYDAVVVEEQGVTAENRGCTTYITPKDELVCSTTNVSYTVTNSECSNASVSFEQYTVYNLADENGRFEVTVGFRLPGGKTSAQTYDQLIGGKSTASFTFSISRTDIAGCFFNVKSAATDAQCSDNVYVSSNAVCTGGVSLPQLTESVTKRYKEVERQRIETKYESIISKFMSSQGRQ